MHKIKPEIETCMRVYKLTLEISISRDNTCIRVNLIITQKVEQEWSIETEEMMTKLLYAMLQNMLLIHSCV